MVCTVQFNNQLFEDVAPRGLTVVSADDNRFGCRYSTSGASEGRAERYLSEAKRRTIPRPAAAIASLFRII